MAGIHMLRSGAWRVELNAPIRLADGKEITEITVNPPSFEHVVRWNNDTISSNLGLLSELTGVAERILRTLTFPDADRVMLALIGVCPPIIRQAIDGGLKPLSTEEDYEGGPAKPFSAVESGLADQVDPRFPAADGPVVRFSEKPPGLGAVPEDSIGIKPPMEAAKPVL